MRKVLLLLVAMVTFAFVGNTVQAQTRIGKEHRLDAGLHYAYGGENLASFVGFNVDFNSLKNNFRVRMDFDMLQRPTKNTSICLGARIDAQYLFPLAEEDADGFYLYPSIGFGADLTQNAGRPSDYGIGVNVGGGAEYQLNDKWALLVEGEYLLRYLNPNYFAVQIGFSHSF